MIQIGPDTSTQTQIPPRRLHEVRSFVEFAFILSICVVLFISHSSILNRKTIPVRISVGPVAINNRGQIVQWSLEAARVTGYRLDEVFGKEFWLLADPSQRIQQKHYFNIETTRTFEHTYSFEIQTPSNRPIELEVCLGGGGLPFLGTVRGK